MDPERLVPGDRTDGTLDVIEFLARSDNRVGILDELRGGGRSVPELTEATGISRASLSRILGEFTDRGWVVRDGRTYRLTQFGRLVAVEFTSFVDRMRTVQQLSAVARWFPAAEYDFDVQRLDTAEVITTTRTEVLAPIEHVIRQIRNCDRLLFLTYATMPTCIAAIGEAILAGDLRAEVVITRAVVESIRSDADLSTQLRALLSTDRAVLSVHDADVPHVLVVADAEVSIVLFDDDGATHAAIRSDDPTVLTWAESEFERYRRDSRPLRATDLEA